MKKKKKKNQINKKNINKKIIKIKKKKKKNQINKKNINLKIRKIKTPFH